MIRISRSAAVLTLTVLAFALVPCARQPAAAADGARLAAAKEMMAVAGVAKSFDVIMPHLTKHMTESFVALAPDKAAEIRDVMQQMTEKFSSRRQELIDEIAGLYAERLTTEEMQAITAFYNTPAGTKFIAVQPELMQQAIGVGQRWGQQLGREIEQEARRELKRRGIDI